MQQKKRTMETTMATIEGLGLEAASRHLPDLVLKAQQEDMSYKDFLDSVMDDEIVARTGKHMRRNMAGAHFPPDLKPLDEFDVGELQGGLSGTQLRHLRELAWMDAHSNLCKSQRKKARESQRKRERRSQRKGRETDKQSGTQESHSASC